jgi:hypothetical protein
VLTLDAAGFTISLSIRFLFRGKRRSRETMKTNKHQTLLLVKQKGGVRAKDLGEAFSYSPGTARSYLSYLGRQDLLRRTGAGHVLTDRGENRLDYFEVAGCADPECPRCQGKGGFFACPRCDNHLPVREARILPEKDFLLVHRHAGVYCPRCLKLLFYEEQARILKIPKETNR